VTGNTFRPQEFERRLVQALEANYYWVWLSWDGDTEVYTLEVKKRGYKTRLMISGAEARWITVADLLIGRVLRDLKYRFLDVGVED
jgi:hypothetical protein